MLAKLYNKSLEHVVLPIGDQFAGGGFIQWLRKYRREQWLPGENLRAMQMERLIRILDHARENVPYYRNIKLGSSDPLESLAQFPIIRKADINGNVDRLVTRPINELIGESGSGSSGYQGTVYMDKSAQASQRAMQALWFEWCGYRMGDSILQTGMTMDRGFVKRSKDLFLKTEYVPAFDLQPSSIRQMLDKAAENSRQYLFGYASSLYVLARSAVESGRTDVHFKYAVSWGDKLFSHYRKTIKEAFGCETLDTYGCTEGAMVGAECPYGKFHLSINQCLIEIVDDDGLPVPPGQMGKVLATRLDNFAMPLIRYYLGDLAELEPGTSKKCECGRELPLLRRVVGRDTDIVRTRSGKSLIVHFFTGLFEHIPEIAQFKIIQSNLDEIDIQYIRGPGFNPCVLQTVEDKIANLLQERLSINWIETSKIEPTKSGKPQIIQSSIAVSGYGVVNSQPR